MASNAEATAIVNAMKTLAKAAKSLKAITDQALGYNSAQSIDWNQLAVSNPEIVADGLIVGTSLAPAEVSNLIGSMDSFRGAWWATNGGNVEKMTDPIV